MRKHVGKKGKDLNDGNADGDSVRYSLRCHRSPKIIAVAGGKGGVGKTIFASMLGMCLAGFKRRTVLVDLDFSGANLHGFLDLPEKTRSLNSFFSGRFSTLSEVVQHTPFENLDAITLQSDGVRSFDVKEEQKQRLFRELKKLKADYVVYDLGNASTVFGLDAFLLADHSVVLTSADMFSVLNTYSFIRSVVLQGIRRYLYDSPTALRALNECGFLIDSKVAKPMHKFLKQIPANNQIRLDAIQQFLRNFSPKIVLNFVEKAEIYSDFLLLDPLVKDLLNIQLDYWGHLRYDSAVHIATRLQRPERLLMSGGPVSEDMVRLVVRNLIAQELSPNNKNEPKWVNPIDHINTFYNESDLQSCHNKCLAWNSCSSRDEGGPCSRVAVHQIKKAG